VVLASHLRRPFSTSFYSVDTPQADVREGTWITVKAGLIIKKKKKKGILQFLDNCYALCYQLLV